MPKPRKAVMPAKRKRGAPSVKLIRMDARTGDVEKPGKGWKRPKKRQLKKYYGSERYEISHGIKKGTADMELAAYMRGETLPQGRGIQAPPADKGGGAVWQGGGEKANYLQGNHEKEAG